MARPCRTPLTIADIPITLVTDQVLPMDEAFAPFTRRSGGARYTARFRETAVLPPIPEKVLWEGPCDRFHPDGSGGWLRSFFDAPRSREPYAVGRYEYAHGYIQVDYLARGRRCVCDLNNTFFHLGLEALLCQEGKFCLHAACVTTERGALLFAGPSGRGKSTQAELWCRHQGGRLLNGDRPILGQKQGRWTAWGSPYAGSSRCYRSDSAPIAAILVLEPWGPCQIRRLPLGEAFRRIYALLTMYSWDGRFTAAALDFAAALAADVPVYAYQCTADAASPAFLAASLEV